MPRTIRPPRFDRAKNGWYYAYYYDAEAGRAAREALGTKSPEEAQARFAVWLTQESPQSVSAPTVNDLLDFYDAHVIEKEIVGKNTVRTQLAHVRAKLGHILADELTSAQVQAYIEEKTQIYASATVRNQVGYLRAAYVAGRKKDFVKCAPPGYDAPSGSDPRERWLTVEEMGRLIEAAQKQREIAGSPRMLPIEIFIHLALRTAARSNALKDLTWDRVHFERGIIDYRSPGWLALPKKRRSKRRTEVPISDKLRPVLQQAHAERTDNYVVPRWRGLKYDWLETLRLAELDGVSPHVLRHTWATHASMNGVSMGDIARVMAITTALAERVYAKYSPTYLRHAVNF